MSEITRAVIQMPYDMAMDGEISRQQFYNRAQTLLAEFDTLAQRLQEAEMLNNRMASLLQGIRRHNSSGLTRDTQDEIDAVLAVKGAKP